MLIKFTLVFITGLLCQLSWAGSRTTCNCGWSNKGKELKMLIKFTLVFITGLLCQLSWAGSRTTCNCGWSNKGKGRIVGGSETKKNEFPWMVSMYDTWRNMHMCGASIITANHAVTAAHCIDGVNGDVSSIVLLVGAHNVWYPNEGKMVPIKNYIKHPNYRSRGLFSDDIALIVTRSAIPMGPNVGPVCLPSQRIELNYQKIKAIGWGQEGPNQLGSPVLLSVDLSVIPYKECQSHWKGLPFPKSQICTLDEGRSTCNGDSGGPLVWYDPEISRYTLAALTSFGKLCVTPPAAVNTEVFVYMDWLKEMIKQTNPATICTKI